LAAFGGKHVADHRDCTPRQRNISTKSEPREGEERARRPPAMARAKVRFYRFSGGPTSSAPWGSCRPKREELLRVCAGIPRSLTKLFFCPSSMPATFVKGHSPCFSVRAWLLICRSPFRAPFAAALHAFIEGKIQIPIRASGTQQRYRHKRRGCPTGLRARASNCHIRLSAGLSATSTPSGRMRCSCELLAAFSAIKTRFAVPAQTPLQPDRRSTRQ